MATTLNLYPGRKYRVKPNGGDLAGEIITVISNISFPDDDPRRRRIPVDHDGETVYLLPRVIEDDPLPEEPQVIVVPQSVPTLDRINAAETFVATQAHDAEIVQQVLASAARKPITDPMDPRLDHFRPSRRKVRAYRNRVMANGWTDIEFLLLYASDPYRATNELRPVNIALKGDTQSGKTFLVEALAVAWSDSMADQQRARGEKVTFIKPMPIFTLSGSVGVSDYDLFGQTTNYTDPVTGVSRLVWLPGVAALAAQCGGILYLDEMNAMKGDVTTSLHPLIDHRHQFVNRGNVVDIDGQLMPEVITASLDLWVIATLNEGYRDMRDVNEAFNARFENILWGYSDEVERMLITSPTIRLFAEALRTARAGKQLRTPVGTKQLERFQLNIEHMGVDMAFANLLGIFKPEERKKVETIFVDRSFKRMLEDEAQVARANAAADAAEAQA